MRKIPEIRPSPIAGQWYLADPQRLAQQVDDYLQQAKLPPLQDEIVGVIAPHAGLMYSGPVAGYSFAALRGMLPEIVAVVAPMHYPYIEALLTTAHTAYSTPLGPIPVDTTAVQAMDARLKEEVGLGLARVAQDPEHSLEIELPFLQRALSEPFKLLPVMMRDQSTDVAQALGKALAHVLKDRRALLVASTDLSHFYPQAAAERLDAEVLRLVERFDPQGVIEVEERGKGYACGRGALAAVLWAAKELGADQAHILHHATSGDVTGDFDRVVGYGSAILTRRKAASGDSEERTVGNSPVSNL